MLFHLLPTAGPAVRSVRLSRDQAIGAASATPLPILSRIFGLASAVIAAMAGLLVATPVSAAQPRVKLATLAPKGTSFHQVLLQMGEQWRSAPGGGANLIIYTDGAMGGEADMVRRMRIGQIHAAMLTVTGLCEIDDSVAALQNIPMVFRSLDELSYVREKLMPRFEQRFRDKGFIILCSGDAGWVYFFSRQPGLYPDDFRKMKIFTWAGDPTSADLWRAAGFQPVMLEITDSLTALQTGLIDAVAAAPTYALAGQFYVPAPNMLDMPWAPLVGATVITEKTWRQFSPETQQALMASARQAAELIQQRSRAESLEAIQAMQKRGLKVHKVTAEIEKVWRDTCEAFYPRIRGSIVPADMYDEVQRLLAEYRSRQPPVGADHAAPD